MTVAIDTGYTLPDANHARLLHDGVALPFTVDTSNTTDVDDAEVYSESAIENGLTVDRYKPNATSWTIDLDLDGGAASVSAICIGSDNLATSDQTITIQNDTTTIHSVAPTIDSPIMFLFSPISSLRWRILGAGGAKPTIYNVMIGNPLKFERPFYGEFSPARMNRQTEVIGNMSRNGELMGRSVKRTILQEQYTWNYLTYRRNPCG